MDLTDTAPGIMMYELGASAPTPNLPIESPARLGWLVSHNPTRSAGNSSGEEAGQHGPSQDHWYNEAVAFLALSTVPGVGYWTLLKLRKKVGSFVEFLRVDSTESLVTALKEYGARGVRELEGEWSDLQRMLWSKGKQLWNQLTTNNITVLDADHPLFPEQLRWIGDPPQWLFCQGNLELLKLPSIALVGTRKPTTDGEFLTRYIVALLSEMPIATVSGLADGIDRLSHEASLRFGLPTIAVLGTGMLQNFPASSRHLREEILRHGGLIISEYLPTQTYSRENFVRRNRIQAGLAKAVIPLEWRIRSGTAHTVRYAAEQKRPIVSLRLPDWTPREHEEIEYARTLGANVFTVPGSDVDIRTYLSDVVCGREPKLEQLSLL